jgi:hypothetical protein
MERLLLMLLTTAPDAGAPVRVTFAGEVTLGFHVEEWADELVKKACRRTRPSPSASSGSRR